ncbi:MAG: hypothetical protein JSS82_12470 [Bacteroidetes bacterium]|nr:hypothetical protein [Bacteroidota bacterium]
MEDMPLTVYEHYSIERKTDMSEIDRYGNRKKKIGKTILTAADRHTFTTEPVFCESSITFDNSGVFTIVLPSKNVLQLSYIVCEAFRTFGSYYLKSLHSTVVGKKASDRAHFCMCGEKHISGGPKESRMHRFRWQCFGVEFELSESDLRWLYDSIHVAIEQFRCSRYALDLVACNVNLDHVPECFVKMMPFIHVTTHPFNACIMDQCWIIAPRSRACAFCLDELILLEVALKMAVEIPTFTSVNFQMLRFCRHSTGYMLSKNDAGYLMVDFQALAPFHLAIKQLLSVFTSKQEREYSPFPMYVNPNAHGQCLFY